MLPTVGLRIDQAPPLHLPFRFFGTGPLFLMLAGAVLLLQGEELLLAPLFPLTVATLHLILLGWMFMVVCGAMIQMIPVLAGIPVPWPGLVPWVHGLLTLGVGLFFFGLSHDPVLPTLLWIALGFLLVAGVAFVVPIGVALVKAPAKHPTVHGMRLAMLAFVGTLLLGALFLGEHAGGFIDFDRRILVAIHLLWGLIGTMGVLIIGVSFQVLPMFYMTPPFPVRSAPRILTGLALALGAVPVMLWISGVDHPWHALAAALPGIAALFWYAVEIRQMMRQRKRRLVDATLRLWLFGYACAVLALLLLASWSGNDWVEGRYLFGILFVLGWVTPVMIGMLHKIIPFLVWFHRFSNLAGLVEIPMMDDLSPLRIVNGQVWVVVGSVVVLVAAVVTGSDLLVRVGGGGLMVIGAMSLYALWFALRIAPPKAPEIPDFASFFKDFKPPVS
ncbi:MAG: hypothetical protein G8237_09775 [Magnetococcales bacterium]|nr:hypothetical protein [Magnetococcales bacterium]NGZ06632.1 hypothetical protein [Magnetococcales bacterium]